MEPQNFSPTPLDNLDINPVQRHPALTWLIWYGAYLLIVRFGYTVGLPLMTSLIANDSSKMGDYYNFFNLLITVGNIAISMAIVVFVKDKLCRVVFSLMILSNLYSLIITLFTHPIM